MNDNQILKNIDERLGISALKPMQMEMLYTDSRHIILIAPTGSGKTIAFAAFMLRHISTDGSGPHAIVIAPSRELVLQIYEVIRPIATGLKTVAFYGGHRMEEEIKSLSVIPDIIIATPGRLLDHINRQNLDISTSRTLVIDEYDKTLELGFAEELRRIVRRIKKADNVVLTSATPLQSLPDYLPQGRYETISVENAHDSRSLLQIVEVESPAHDKLDTLVDLLYSIPKGKTIVFVNHRESAERLHDALNKRSIPAGLYHGGLDQLQRETAIDLLNNGTTPILISTDLASRGLDIDNVQNVIHYHIPPTAENWIHRNGRTARNGAEGTAYVIVSEADTLPEYVTFDRSYRPPLHGNDACIKSPVATLHFNLGKKEKISRGDILGYLTANTDLEASQIGRIALKDHSALVAVPSTEARDLTQKLKDIKIKNKRVRVTQVKP